MLKKLALVGLLLASLIVAFIMTMSCDSQTEVVAPVFAPAEKVTEVEGITEYRLANGLQVLLFPDLTKETVTVNVTYLVGSKHENYGETGMAHLLEHLLFKGTPKHPNIPEELSKAGARPNGTTWTDRTNYYETFAATEENIEWALSMESSRMTESFVSKEDLDSEMTVVRNEFERGENNPVRVTIQQMASIAYDWHNYGKSTIGARSDLENVPIDRLKAFYKKYYQPDNATLIVAGKFDSEDMIKRVEKYFAPIPKPTRVLPKLYTDEPAKSGERSVTVRRVGDAQWLGTAYHIPAGSHEDFAAISVLSAVLGDTPSGRLHKALVEENIASRVFGFNFQWQDPGLALYFAQLDQDTDVEVAEQAMLDVIESVENEPITEEEVERIKRNLLKNIELAFNSSERIALQLSEWLGMGDWRLYFLNRDRIEAVTVEDVQRVAEKYLVANNRTLGKFIPTDEPERIEIPETPNVAELLEGYVGREAIAQGELFEPSFDNIDSRTNVLTLENGAELALLSKKTRGESVSVSMRFNYGDLESLTNKATIASATGSMLLRGGAGLTRQEIQDEFDKLKAQVGVSASVSGLFVRINTTRENLAATIELVANIVRNPSFDEDEFKQLVATVKVDIEQNLQDPQRLAFNEYRRLQAPYDKGHPFYTPTLQEQLDLYLGLQLDDLKAFYETFYGAQYMTASVVGDFDEQAIKSVIENSFIDWTSSQTFAVILDEYKDLTPVRKEFDTPDKENATFVAGMMLPIGENHPDAPALELGNYIFGGGFLNSRMATRLRQEDGLSYGAGSFITMRALSDKTMFGAYAIAAPQNLSKVETGFKEELVKMLEEGFTDEEIENAKSGLLQSKKVSRAQDRELVGKLRSHLFLDRTMQWEKQYEARLTELDKDAVQAVMKKYLDVDKFFIVMGGDKSKIE